MTQHNTTIYIFFVSFDIIVRHSRILTQLSCTQSSLEKVMRRIGAKDRQTNREDRDILSFYYANVLYGTN